MPDSSLVSNTPVSALTLAQLARCTVEERFALLLPSCRGELERALAELDAIEPDLSTIIGVQRPMWAIALNLALTDEERLALELSTEKKKAPRKTLESEFSDDSTWGEIWAAFLPLDGQPTRGGLSLLAQLALFVACEERPDRQWPGARNDLSATATHVQELFYVRYEPRLRRWLRGAFRDLDHENVAHETIARVFGKYFHVEASNRYMGLHGIFAFLQGIAANVANDVLRKHPPLVSLTVNSGEDGDREHERKEPAVDHDHQVELFMRQAAVHMLRCLKRVLAQNTKPNANPERDRLICEARWLRKTPLKQLAERHGITEARLPRL